MKDRRLLVFLLLPLPLAAAAEWNVATGGSPGRAGFCDVTGPDDDGLLWQGGASAVISWQPVISGETMFTARCFDISDVLHGTFIYAYDIHDGTLHWTADLPVDFPATDWRNHLSAARDTVVYASRAGNTNSSYLYALSAFDGSRIWRSEDLVDESSTEGLSFAPDGDPVVGCFGSIIRVESSDGTTVWQVPRNSPTSGGSEVAVYGDRVYGWTAGASGPTIRAFDLDDGAFLYESPPLGGGYVQQAAPFAGPDGTVYAPRSQNNATTDYLFALEDSGTGLSITWQAELGYVPFASFAVGQDGSVYCYGREGQVLRIDPSTGQVTGSSQDVGAGIGTRMAADAAGRLYVSSGSTLYAFDAALNLLWSDQVGGIDGPALACDGTMLVCGTGTEVRAYEAGSSGTGGGAEASTARGLSLLENPVTGTARFLMDIQGQEEAAIGIYGPDGRMAAMTVLPAPVAGIVEFDVSGLPDGSYTAVIFSGGEPRGSAGFVLLGP
ncbi:MAG: hypothetical protein AVO35_03140 [Candidatus Aegiribacteria sp. MLS_C]|nr:MAG: hypothetical protein AVO35_03140 [Candidatus Aegiribacteria sp. MLS_C]